MRARVFVDFWNFQLNWQQRVAGNCDWKRLPNALLTEAQNLLASTGQSEPLTLEETLVYASVDPVSEASLKRWLTDTIERMPSYHVTLRERRPRPRTIHCSACGADVSACVACGHPYSAKPEKGVDAAIVTDLLALAFQQSYEIAILVSSDADFIPAVEYLQGTGGVRVVNVSWRGHGFDLKKKCWASFDLDDVASTILR